MKFDFENLFPRVDDSSILLLMCQPADYSASVICRAVEDCDSHVLNLDVTAGRDLDGSLMVSLRIDRRDADPVVRSLERFGYNAMIVESPDETADVARARERANELLRYLEL